MINNFYFNNYDYNKPYTKQMTTIYVIVHNNNIKSYCYSKDSARNAVQELADFLEQEAKKGSNTANSTITKTVLKFHNDDRYRIDIYEQSLGYIVNGTPELKHSIEYHTCPEHDGTQKPVPIDPNKKVFVVYKYDLEDWNEAICGIDIYDTKAEAEKRRNAINNDDYFEAAIQEQTVYSKYTDHNP